MSVSSRLPWKNALASSSGGTHASTPGWRVPGPLGTAATECRRGLCAPGALPSVGPRHRVLPVERGVLAEFLGVELAEVGTGEVGVLEVGALEACAREHRVDELDRLEICSFEEGAVHHAVREVRSGKVRSGCVDLGQLGILEVDLFEAAVREERAGNIKTACRLAVHHAFAEVVERVAGGVRLADGARGEGAAPLLVAVDGWKFEGLRVTVRHGRKRTGHLQRCAEEHRRCEAGVAAIRHGHARRPACYPGADRRGAAEARCLLRGEHRAHDRESYPRVDGEHAMIAPRHDCSELR
mmetsp:Transcript_1432/g.4154  ORF Transcript_1432/g.4154 Transcript_1432/m.4154 type:complete len:297 (+) Transcript_1432:140-1030(+)